MADLVRIVLHPDIARDGLFLQPDTREWDNDKKAEHEVEEFHNRERFAAKFHYADEEQGDHRTYDPKGRYNCGRCNQAESEKCELIGKALKLELEAGSCFGWENLFAGDPELDFGRKGVATAEQLMYGVAKNGIGFGCVRCPYREKAYEPDSLGRDQFCRKGYFRVPNSACCALNGAEVKSEYEGNSPARTP